MIEIDDFPFNELIDGKEEFSSLVRKVHAYLVDKMNEGWNETENEKIRKGTNLLLNIIRVYIKMGCIKGTISKLSLRGSTIYWKIGIQYHSLSFHSSSNSSSYSNWTAP